MQLQTSDEFAQWYAALDDAAAEDVAATLEVITQLGTEKEAPGSSEWLTWYEHPSLAAILGESALAPATTPDPTLLRLVHEWGAFHGYAKRVVKHLESPSFAGRLGQLDAVAAAAVSASLARIKETVTRRSLAMSDLQVRRRLGTHPLTAEQERAFVALVEVQEIRDAYLAALGAAGFDVVDVPAHSPALREIALRIPAPGLRLLYGIDVRRKQGLVVIGERLDRSFYGDSVRRAERQWQEFLAGEPAAARPTGAR